MSRFYVKRFFDPPVAEDKPGFEGSGNIDAKFMQAVASQEFTLKIECGLHRFNRRAVQDVLLRHCYKAAGASACFGVQATKG